jgi:hypothetical protein
MTNNFICKRCGKAIQYMTAIATELARRIMVKPETIQNIFIGIYQNEDCCVKCRNENKKSLSDLEILALTFFEAPKK